MHELSISMSILEIAEEESDRRGGATVNAVHVKLGALSGVVKNALLSSWELACEGTGLQGSRLMIDEVPVEVFCPRCQQARTIESVQWFVCPACGSPVSEVIRGREIQLWAMEMEEESEEVPK